MGESWGHDGGTLEKVPAASIDGTGGSQGAATSIMVRASQKARHAECR